MPGQNCGRIGLILQHQLTHQSSEILEELLLQADGDPIVSERELFRRAQREGVIDEPLLRTLEELYTKRNRVVHRYIISEITTSQVIEIAAEFEAIVPQVNAAVVALEDRQVETGVGMSRSGEFPGLGRRISEMSRAKHGDPVLAKALKNEQS
jgi:uncharacterized protein YutE (UPF0331/DUF86 family)